MAIIRGGNWLDEYFPRWESSVWGLSGWEFSGWEFSGWDFSWVGVVQVRVFLDGSYPGGSFPGWKLSGWEFSRWEFSWVGIVQVRLILGGNFLWWKFFGWGLSGGNHPGGNFPGGSFHVTPRSNLLFRLFYLEISSHFSKIQSRLSRILFWLSKFYLD